MGVPETLGSLVVASLFAWWGSEIARAKGYNPGMGAVVGFFGNCCGIAVLYILPPSLAR